MNIDFLHHALLKCLLNAAYKITNVNITNVPMLMMNEQLLQSSRLEVTTINCNSILQCEKLKVKSSSTSLCLLEHSRHLQESFLF